MVLTDLAASAEVARDAGALLVVDNTFATPVLQRPLEVGADIVVHSTTKYLNGHSDVVGGAVIVRSADQDERLRYQQMATGGVPGPLDCWLVLRSTKTLHLRMRAHCDNAQVKPSVWRRTRRWAGYSIRVCHLSRNTRWPQGR